MSVQKAHVSTNQLIQSVAGSAGLRVAEVQVCKRIDYVG
jgi:hypothetical protein